jgi:HEPN domain-containing protein
MDETVKELVKLWQIKADNDLLTAENELKAEKTVTDSICFHSQQAVEKYLKSYLVALQQPYTYTHNITEILRACINHDHDFRQLDYALILTAYAVELRYPDDFNIPDIEEAKKAYEIASAVKIFVLKKINEICRRDGD